LADAAITLERLDRAGPPAAPLEGVVIDQIHLSFLPRVAVVTPGTQIRFLNSDPLPHNVFGPDGRRESFDLGTYPEGDWAVHTFLAEGVHVVLCHIHPEMAAYVLVSSAPFRAVSDAQGGFAMDGVPPGRYRLRAWHPRRSGSTGEMLVTVMAQDVVNLRLVVTR